MPTFLTPRPTYSCEDSLDDLLLPATLFGVRGLVLRAAPGVLGLLLVVFGVGAQAS